MDIQGVAKGRAMRSMRRVRLMSYKKQREQEWREFHASLEPARRVLKERLRLLKAGPSGSNFDQEHPA